MNYEVFLELCKQNHISQTALLKNLEISISSIDNWKKGSEIKSENLKKLSKYFRVTTDYLLGLTENPNPPAQEHTKSGDILYSPQSSSEININNQKSELETELYSIYKNLSVKKKIELIKFAYELENKGE
jgi:transcriptional regulator with XRE-family HTH domain